MRERGRGAFAAVALVAVPFSVVAFAAVTSVAVAFAGLSRVSLFVSVC